MFLIEFFQMREDGLQYFVGWNIIEFLQLVCFYILTYFRFFYKHDESALVFFPSLKFLNILLAFAEMSKFVRVVDELGFLVQMVITVLGKLIPFFLFYAIFVLIFSICNVVLKLDIDPEVNEAQKLNKFGKTALQVVRTGLGELGMPIFKTVVEGFISNNEIVDPSENTYFRMINVYLIWILWFVTVFFLHIFMINF